MKKAIIVTLVIIAVLVGFGVWVMSHMDTSSQIAVIGPGEPVTFRIDGGEARTVGGKARVIVKVEPGSHEVEVLSPKPLKRTVTVPDGRRMVVPVLDTQCFGKMDFFMSHYVSAKKAPRLSEVVEHTEPFESSKFIALHPNELPDSVERGPVWLLRSASCAQMHSALKAQKRLDTRQRAKSKTRTAKR